jgi:hypothetical protein
MLKEVNSDNRESEFTHGKFLLYLTLPKVTTMLLKPQQQMWRWSLLRRTGPAGGEGDEKGRIE